MITKELLEELEKLEGNNAVTAVMHHFDPTPVMHNQGWMGVCPECKYALSPASKYCPRCGKAVKWNASI